MPRPAAATGLATIDEASDRVLDAWYPEPALGEEPAPLDPGLGPAKDGVRGVRIEPVETRIDLDTAPADVPDAYLSKAEGMGLVAAKRGL